MALAALLTWTFAIQAQKALLFGTITDSEDGDFLPSVSVLYGNGQGTVTDLYGRYRLDLEPGEYTVRFSLMGYQGIEETVNLQPGEGRELNLSLRFSSRELNLVVVTASQYEKNIARENITTEVISAELIQNTVSRDLGEALNRTPGVQVQDGQVTIRGGSAYSYGVGSRTGVLIDGISAIDSDFGEAQLRLAPIENTQQIEVVKGAASVVYGAAALNGVVNVRTAWPTNEQPVNELRVYSQVMGRAPRPELVWWEGRQPNNTGMYYSYQRKIDNLQVVAGGHMDNVQSYLEDADEFRLRANVKTRWLHRRVEGLSYGVNANVMREVADRFFLSADLDSNAYRVAEGSQDRYVRTYVDPHLTFLRNGHQYRLQARYMNIFRRGNGSDINAIGNSFRTDNQYQYNWRDRLYITAGLPLDWGISRHNLYQGQDTIFNPDTDTLEVVGRPIWRANYNLAAYTQIEYRTNRLSLTGGVRYEAARVDTVFNTTRPVARFGINYLAGRASYLRASWGQAYRLPSIAERFVASEFFSGVFLVPNALLEAEVGWSAEVGYKQGLKIGEWKGFVDLATFWQEYENFVEYRFGLFPNRDEFGNVLFPDASPVVIGLKPNNVETARVAGYEIGLASEGELGRLRLTTMIGYTYTFPADLEAAPELRDAGAFLELAWKDMFRRIEGEAAEQLLQFRTRHLLRGDIGFQAGRWRSGVSVFYTSFPERIPETFFLITDQLDGGKGTLDTYIGLHEKGDWVFDARLGTVLNNERVRLDFIVKNLTNREYSQRPGRLEPPRSFTVQVGLDLARFAQAPKSDSGGTSL
jgi:outer membrane receptor protein involved in Fe transport